MAIGLKYSTNQSPDNNTRKTDIKGQENPQLTSDGLKYILGVGYDTGDDTAIPYLVSTKNILMNSDLATYATKSDLSDYTKTSELDTYIGNQGYIKNTALNGYATQNWVTQQGYLTEHQSLDSYYNKTEVNNLVSGKSISVENVPTASTSDNNAYCQALLQGGSVVCYVPVSTSSGLTYAKEYYATSDKSLKENVTEVTPDNNILNVPIVEFNWKDTKTKSVGVIAQDLEKVAPIAVSTSDSGMKSVNYTTFLLLRIAALEEELKEIKEKLS